MNSGKYESSQDPVALRLSLEQFEMLFQVTKEFRSLSDMQLAAIGVEVKDVDRLLEFVRSMRRRMEGASRIQISVVFDEAMASKSPVLIRESPELDAASFAMHGAVTGQLLAAWGRLSEAAILSLGPRELFLRTGYDEEEIRQVTNQLERA